MSANEKKKKTAKIEIVKKICPLNPDLDCPDCRFYEMSERGIMRCVFYTIMDNLAFMRLNMGGEK